MSRRQKKGYFYLESQSPNQWSVWLFYYETLNFSSKTVSLLITVKPRCADKENVLWC